MKSGAYYYRYGDFQPRHKHRHYRLVPWTYVKGYWLNQAGFNVGNPVQAKISRVGLC
ncbi:MAG: SymE family type I addiction module toxin [Exilibacterium sp.]